MDRLEDHRCGVCSLHCRSGIHSGQHSGRATTADEKCRNRAASERMNLKFRAEPQIERDKWRIWYGQFVRLCQVHDGDATDCGRSIGLVRHSIVQSSRIVWSALGGRFRNLGSLSGGVFGPIGRQTLLDIVSRSSIVCRQFLWAWRRRVFARTGGRL